ncbi:MAG: TatD family hydrolase [bacterium]|nr:TatD family hydrolase [bacterium]
MDHIPSDFPRLFDTHTHLSDQKFDSDRQEVLKRCNEWLVGWINVGSDLNSTIKSIAIANEFPKSFASSGIHPHDASTHSYQEIEEIISLYNEPNVIAAGEMGLDFFYDNSPRETQIEIFERQLLAAKKSSMPCIIHVRDAFEEFFEVIRRVDYCNGVVHCFTGNIEQAKKVIELGFYTSFGGILTFKNASDVRESMLSIPQERLLLETDCPYLAPVPMRGKRNEPCYVSYVALRVAELRGIELGELLHSCFNNTLKCFQLESIFEFDS